jgi:hypothetical protein
MRRDTGRTCSDAKIRGALYKLHRERGVPHTSSRTMARLEDGAALLTWGNTP